MSYQNLYSGTYGLSKSYYGNHMYNDVYKVEFNDQKSLIEFYNINKDDENIDQKVLMEFLNKCREKMIGLMANGISLKISAYLPSNLYYNSYSKSPYQGEQTNNNLLLLLL